MVMCSDHIHMNMPTSGVSQLDGLARLGRQKLTGNMIQYCRLAMVGTSKKQQAPASLPVLADGAETHIQTAR